MSDVVREYYNRVNGLSYTDRDFEAIRERIVERIPELTDKWTDFNESDPGMVFIEVLAAVQDLLCYYIDRQALECFMHTVTQRKNAQAILSPLGYTMKTSVPAVAKIKVIVERESEVELVVPKYSQMFADTKEGLMYFLTNEELRIPALTPFATEYIISSIQGKKSSRVKPFSDVDNATGEFVLDDEDIAFQTLRIVINGEDWLEVEDVLLEAGSIKCFSVRPCYRGGTTVQLSTGWRGLKGLSTEFNIEWCTTSGSKGNLATGVVDSFDTSLGLLGVAESLSVTNIEPYRGGEDPESIEWARLKSKREIKTMWTAVILEDYEILAEKFPGIIKASAIDWHTQPLEIFRPYYIEVYVVPAGGVGLSSELEDNLQAYFDERKMVDKIVDVKEAIYRSVDVSLRVYLKEGKEASVVQSAVESAVREHFDPYNREFGSSIYASNIITAAETCNRNIRYVVLTEPSESEVILKRYEFPTLGTLSVEVVG